MDLDNRMSKHSKLYNGSGQPEVNSKLYNGFGQPEVKRQKELDWSRCTLPAALPKCYTMLCASCVTQVLPLALCQLRYPGVTPCSVPAMLPKCYPLLCAGCVTQVLALALCQQCYPGVTSCSVPAALPRCYPLHRTRNVTQVLPPALCQLRYLCGMLQQNVQIFAVPFTGVAHNLKAVHEFSIRHGRHHGNIHHRHVLSHQSHHTACQLTYWNTVVRSPTSTETQ